MGIANFRVLNAVRRGRRALSSLGAALSLFVLGCPGATPPPSSTPSTGACCVDGNCNTAVTPTTCTNQGGIWQGTGTVRCTDCILPPNGDDVIFPTDYRASFVEVRDCRSSLEGHGPTIRVLVNAIGADQYLADAATLPEGTIVVKEEFSGDVCTNDADLFRWSSMRKEPLGFDPAANDWRFQRVSSPNRTITEDGNATCIGCHRAPACLARDQMCTVP